MKSASSSFIIFSASSSAFPRTLADDACGGCNTGICVEPSAAETAATTAASSSSSSSIDGGGLGSKPSCDCRNTGYAGEHCQVPCSKQCRNGGKCVPPARTDATTQEETCACAKAVVDGNPYAGIHCEYGATQSCMTLGSESKHSFCTNGGRCVEIVGDNEAHVPCDCPDGYAGDKCEYLMGRVPSSYYSNSTSSSSAASAMEQQQQQKQSENQSVIFFAVIVAMGAMIVLVLLGMVVRAHRRRREDRRQEREARRATEDFSMVPMRDRRRDGDDAEEDEDGII